MRVCIGQICQARMYGTLLREIKDGLYLTAMDLKSVLIHHRSKIYNTKCM